MGRFCKFVFSYVTAFLYVDCSYLPNFLLVKAVTCQNKFATPPPPHEYPYLLCVALPATSNDTLTGALVSNLLQFCTIQLYSSSTSSLFYHCLHLLYCNRVRYFRGKVSNFNQSEARKHCFLASDRLKFETLPQKYRTAYFP